MTERVGGWRSDERPCGRAAWRGSKRGGPSQNAARANVGPWQAPYLVRDLSTPHLRLPALLQKNEDSRQHIAGRGSGGGLTAITAPTGAERLVDPNDMPEPPDDPTTQPDDLWILGNHRLLCGNSDSVADLDGLLGGATIREGLRVMPSRAEPAAKKLHRGLSGTTRQNW